MISQLLKNYSEQNPDPSRPPKKPGKDLPPGTPDIPTPP